MKDIIFIWLAVIIYASVVVIAGLVPPSVEIPFDGAIFLLGASIAGYTGVKTVGISLNASSLPTGEGVSDETRKKLKGILIAIYVLILETVAMQVINKDVEIPMNNLLYMAGICSGIILAGNQAMKTSELKNGN